MSQELDPSQQALWSVQECLILAWSHPNRISGGELLTICAVPGAKYVYTFIHAHGVGDGRVIIHHQKGTFSLPVSH